MKTIFKTMSLLAFSCFFSSFSEAANIKTYTGDSVCFCAPANVNGSTIAQKNCAEASEVLGIVSNKAVRVIATCESTYNRCNCPIRNLASYLLTTEFLVDLDVEE